MDKVIFGHYSKIKVKLMIFGFGTLSKHQRLARIYNLCAGDYEMIKNVRADSLTPMRIFVRKSKKSYVDSDMIFRVLTQGIKFYSEMFDYPFPFSKYDVIYCPEFRIGAMENVGAVTFTDRILVPFDELDDS